MSLSNLNSIYPPIAPKIPHELVAHGDTRIDEHYWMRYKEDPELIKYLEAENAYTAAMTADLKKDQDQLYKEFVGRTKQTDETAPVKDGEYWYSKRTIEGLNYPIYIRRKGSPSGPEQVYLDVNVLAEGKEYMKVTCMDVSHDGKYLAYLVDESGYESCTLKFRDLDTGKDLPYQIDDVGAFSVAWGYSDASKPVVFYTHVDGTKRPNRIMRYCFSDMDSENPIEVFCEDDVKFNVDVRCTLSGAFVTITSTSSTTSEVWVVSTRNPESVPSLLRKREQGVMYKVSQQKKHGSYPPCWWFITDHDGAMNYKVMTALENKPDEWREVIPESPDVLIEDITCFESQVVISERRGGLTAIRVINQNSTQRVILTTPEAICEINLGQNNEYVTSILRVQYESPITPPSTYDVSFDTYEWTLVKQVEVLGGYDSSLYEVSRRYAIAKDGAQVPMSIVYRKGIILDGTNLGYLYGYGSYGSCIEPSFSSNLISLLDRGVVCAIAHVRGGSEMGRAWKEGGKMMNKMNTFTDFISCAEELIRLKYTSADRLAIEGGSAGGLLIGAVVNMRPDLFMVAHAAVPFVDVVTTMLDETIPLTTEEWEEWGNPSEKEAYEYMKSYSPYDNVKAQDYPNMLITSGINDPRVAYWEPTKWIARLRERSTGDGVKLLKMNMGSGHGGSSGRYDRLKEVAFQWAYLLHHIMKK